MNADGKSDGFILPATRGNKTGTPAADLAEERKSPKGRVIELSSMCRTLSRITHQLERHGDRDKVTASAVIV